MSLSFYTVLQDAAVDLDEIEERVTNAMRELRQMRNRLSMWSGNGDFHSVPFSVFSSCVDNWKKRKGNRTGWYFCRIFIFFSNIMNFHPR